MYCYRRGESGFVVWGPVRKIETVMQLLFGGSVFLSSFLCNLSKSIQFYIYMKLLKVM